MLVGKEFFGESMLSPLLWCYYGFAVGKPAAQCEVKVNARVESLLAHDEQLAFGEVGRIAYLEYDQQVDKSSVISIFCQSACFPRLFSGGF